MNTRSRPDRSLACHWSVLAACGKQEAGARNRLGQGGAGAQSRARNRLHRRSRRRVHGARYHHRRRCKLRLEDLMAAPLPRESRAAQRRATPAPAPVATLPPRRDAASRATAAASQTTETVAAVARLGRVAGRGSGLQHHARRSAATPAATATHASKVRATASRVKDRPRARSARPMPRPSPPMSNAAPIPSSARATGSCASMARPSSSPAMPSSPRRAATSTSAMRASAPAASASSRARRACTSSTAPSAARAVRTKLPQGAEIYVARSTFSGVGRRFDTATMNDLGGNEYQLHH